MNRPATGLPALFVLISASALVVGCGRGGPSAPPHPGRKITAEEYQQMSPEQRDDPYTKAHLDAPASGNPGGRP